MYFNILSYRLDLTIIKMGCMASKSAKSVNTINFTPSYHRGRKSISKNTATCRSPDHGEESRSLSPTDDAISRASDGLGEVIIKYPRVSIGLGRLEYQQTKTLPKIGNYFINITSSVVLQDNSVVLCDSSNSMLYLLDSKLNFRCYVTVDNEPHAMCIVDNTETCYEIAVTFPKRRSIQLFKISSGTMLKVEEINTDSECWGICCFNRSLIFSTDSGLLFRDVGKNKSRVKRYGHVFQSKVPLTLATNVVYICSRGSDDQESSVKGMRVSNMDEDDGEIIFKKYFPIQTIMFPVSCAVDNDDNVYICDNAQKDIMQLNSVNGGFRNLKARGGITEGWQHINFFWNSNKIILIEARSNHLFIFKLI